MNDDICPGCGKRARRLPVWHWSGWLWRCDPCDWNFGHPQMHRAADSQEASQ